MKCKKKFIIIGLLLLFCVVAILLNNSYLDKFDENVYHFMIGLQTSQTTTIMLFFTTLGNFTAVAVICLVIVLLDRSMRWSIPIIATMALTSGLNIILKETFARNRPTILRLADASGYSFPSAHAMMNSALYTMIILLTYKYIQSKTTRIAITVVAIVIIVGIGISRIYLGVHYPSDVVAGYTLGVAIALLIDLRFSNTTHNNQ